MTFLERSRMLLGGITLALIVVGTAAALALQGGMFRGGYEVTAELADASGLRTGDLVLVAGIRAGEVRAVDLAGDRVEATLFIDEGTELTHDTRMRVIIRTLVGKRAVQLIPSDDWSRLLTDGDRIPQERVSLPVDVPEFADVSEALLRETDAEVLDEFLRSMTDVTREQRAQIETLIQGGTRLTAVVNDQEQEVRELLRRLRVVAETFAARDEQIAAIIDDFGVTLAELVERREDLRALFRETNSSARVAADLVESERDELDRILTEVHALTDILNRNQLALAEALAYSGDAIEGFASIAWAGPVPVPWGNVFTTSLGPAGVDVIGGCGGLIDQHLDEIFGPDPRTCAEQENRSFPDDAESQEDEEQASPIPGIPVLPGLSATDEPRPIEDVGAVLRRGLREGER